MKFSRILQVVIAVLVLGLVTSNLQASTIFASGDAPKHKVVKASTKHHKHHKHIAKHHRHHHAATA